ncbi:MAG: hypothetical protein H7Z75_17300 [Ferruginibacter sp.]|nr:hypothetical protein [Cytophagales bacterium]
MPRYTILEAPSNLGLKPTGVERLADALKNVGLPQSLGADYAGCIATRFKDCIAAGLVLDE